MKKYLMIFAAALTALVSCSKDNYIAGPGGSGSGGSSSEEEQTTEIADKIDGRVALAYCTYYGTRIPDCRYITNINYGFAELYVVNGVYKGFKLQGAYDKNTNPETRFSKIVALKKQYPDLKISISFTHTVANYDNSQGGGFSAMAKTEEGRKAFAKDCLAFLNKWGIDGIDIDWEFPGLSWSGHACDTEVDVENFTLLMKQLRETLGSRYLLTYAGYVMDKKSDSSGNRYIDIKAVEPYVDFVNIMTYDIASGAEGQHQSPLKKASNYWDCDRAVKAYLNAGVPASKLVLGIPFYARHAWDNSDGYKGCVDYDDFGTEFPTSKGFKIDNWDSEGQVPYVTKDGKYWAGYDNVRSIGIKADWIREKGMMGLMYWDYGADDSQGTLRNAVWNSVMKK